MNKNISKLLATALVVGLVSGGNALAGGKGKKAEATKKAAKGNGCSGKNGCGNGCKGKDKNQCKGKKTTDEEHPAGEDHPTEE